MKKLVVAGLLSIVFTLPALAEKHKVMHPKPVHKENPYLKHPNHKALRGHHKKI
jgi:hypothetical protein